MSGPRPIVAFAPTLRSTGGVRAALGLLGQLVPGGRVDGAIVSPEAADVLGSVTGTVTVVHDRREARRALAALPTGAVVVCLQNPAPIPAGVDAVSVVQNHAALHPVTAARCAWSPREAGRCLALAVVTGVQLRRSRIWWSLNSRVPWPFRLIGTWGGVVSNRGLAADLERPRTPTGDTPTLVWIGSHWGFRRPLVALDAFSASGLGERGWRLTLVASRGDARLRRHVHREVARRRAHGLDIELVEDAPPEEVLARLEGCRAALFTSLVEGSSVSFVEACALAPVVVAPATAEFTESAPPLAPVRWLASDGIDDWAAALAGLCR